MTDQKQQQLANARRLLAAAQTKRVALTRQREDLARQITAADAQITNLGQLVRRLRA
jgi:predicted site-specific integrase-resolvase